VRQHEFEEPRVDGGPDRRARRALTGGAARDVVGVADARHVLDGHLDAQFELLLLRRVHDRDRSEIVPCAIRAELVVDRSFGDGRARCGLTPV